MARPFLSVKTFFAYRLSKIHASTNTADWLYVPTDSNPADFVSRGLMPDDEKWNMFHKGPDFLWQNESEWPKPMLLKGPHPEEILASVAVTDVVSIPPHWAVRIMANVSSWPKGVKKIAMFEKAVRAMVNWRQKGIKIDIKKLTVNLEELQWAEDLLVRAIQGSQYRKHDECP